MDVEKNGSMKNLEFIKNVDIYLLDQCFKGNIDENSKVLDAGFGKGRNFRFLSNQGVNITGIDSKHAFVESLKSEFPKNEQSIIHSSIEDFETNSKFDFIVCNAVLHFAKNHQQLDEMFEKLVRLMDENGILFIRMTSDIGIESFLKNGVSGVYNLPDGSSRHLITRSKIDEFLEKYQLNLLEPVKTVNVDNLRCMTTLVLQN